MPQPPTNSSCPRPQANKATIVESQERFRGLIQSLCDEYVFLSQCYGDVTQGSSPLPDFQDGIDVQSGQPSPLSPGSLTAKLVAMAPAVSQPQAMSTPPLPDMPELHLQPEGNLTPAKGSEAAEAALDAASKELQALAAKEAALDAAGKALQADPETLEAMEEELNHEYIDKLRKQFDLLDIEQDGLVTLDQCDMLVEHFTGEKVCRQDLLESLKIVDDTEGLCPQAEDNGTAIQVDVKITFEQFLHLMGADGTNEKSDGSSDKITDVLKVAFSKALAAAEALAQQADERKAKHERLVFLLDLLPAPVILFNAIVLGLRADVPSQEPLWKGLDVFFFVFYSLECAVKLHVFGCVIYCCGPERMWNWLDICCVLISLVDNGMTLLRVDASAVGDVMLLKMVRLLKLARIVKALHYPIFTELKFMIAGVASGMRTLLWALVLLLFIIYFVGVTMRIMIGEHYSEFQTVPAAMFTVFRCLTDGCAAYNGTPLQEHIREEYGLIFIVPYVLVIMIVIFGLFNLIMAVFVDNVTGDSAARRQEKLGRTARATKRSIQVDFAQFIMKCKSAPGKKHRLLTHAEKEAMMKQAEVDALAAFHSLPEHIAISRQIFEEWVQTPNFIQLLDIADVDTSNTSELFEALDADMDGRLTPTEIVDGLMKLRGPITKVDMIATRLKARYCTHMLDHIHRAVVGATSSDLC